MFGKTIDLKAEVVSGICPSCERKCVLISLMTDNYRCVNCGEFLEQKVNGVIKYLPIGKEILVDKNNGTT